MVYGCKHTAINDTHKRIREKIGDIDKFTIKELIDYGIPAQSIPDRNPRRNLYKMYLAQ